MLFQITACRKAASPHVLRNVFGLNRLAAQTPGGPAPQGQRSFDFVAAVRGARDDVVTFSSQNVRRMAIMVDYQLGSMCRQRRRPSPEYDAQFGSDADASPWQHGAPPLWLLQIFCREIVDVNVSELQRAVPTPLKHVAEVMFRRSLSLCCGVGCV